ncbi:MAG: methyltransferase domain-containing protein [Bryobacteraceae bacterium]
MIVPRTLPPVKLSALACPSCRQALDEAMSCVCGFRLENRDGVLVESGERSGSGFENYAAESGIAGYNEGDLSEHEYYDRFFRPGTQFVLDAGAGDGNTSAHWARANPGSHLYAVDCDEGSLRRAAGRGLPNLTAIKAPATRMPLAGEFFDAVLTVFMVEHLYDWELSDFYVEAWRVLRPGGALIVTSDAPFFDKFIHPFLRLARTRRWRTSSFLERWKPAVRSIHHHNLKTGRQAARDLERHGYFVQGLTVPLLFSNAAPAAAFYEVLSGIVPAPLIERFFGTSYTVVALKPRAADLPGGISVRYSRREDRWEPRGPMQA